MTRKKQDIRQQQREARGRARMSASLLDDQYPQVDEIVIEMKFTDIDGVGHPQPQTQTTRPGMRAFFEISCPFRECVDGGFDLDAAVSETIAERKTEASGELRCQGWQDRNRIGKHRCLLELAYSIRVRYKP